MGPDKRGIHTGHQPASALYRFICLCRAMGGWHTMPSGSILTLAVGKIVLMPVLGVAICQGLTSVGVIDKNDKVLRFVCMYVSPLVPIASRALY